MAQIELHLAVQYATDAATPRRAQVRRWVASTLALLPTTRVRSPVTLTVRFVAEPEGRVLNRSFRNKDYATNVLTFPFDDADGIEADIVICMPVLEAEALAQRKPLAAHLAHLVVHGTLHACGYDHESARDADAMERLERNVLGRFRIADPYRDDGRA